MVDAVNSEPNNPSVLISTLTYAWYKLVNLSDLWEYAGLKTQQHNIKTFGKVLEKFRATFNFALLSQKLILVSDNETGIKLSTGLTRVQWTKNLENCSTGSKVMNCLRFT